MEVLLEYEGQRETTENVIQSEDLSNIVNFMYFSYVKWSCVLGVF
jgi:hypothetical protein